MSHVRAFPMHTYFFFSIYLLYLKCFGTFLIISLSLPLFLFTLVVSIAPNRKSTPSQNPFRSGTSSSSDPTLSHLQFRDDDAHKAFSENFSRCGIHSKRQVILADFVDTDLLMSFTVGDGSHCVTSRSPILSCLSRSFTSTCMRLIVQYLFSSLASDLLWIPRVEFPDYPGCEHLPTVSKDELKSTFCKHPSEWGERQFTYCSAFPKGPRFF